MHTEHIIGATKCKSNPLARKIGIKQKRECVAMEFCSGPSIWINYNFPEIKLGDFLSALLRCVKSNFHFPLRTLWKCQRRNIDNDRNERYVFQNINETSQQPNASIKATFQIFKSGCYTNSMELWQRNIGQCPTRLWKQITGGNNHVLLFKRWA